MSRTFEARYGGRCAADCGRPIEPGDDVAYTTDDELVHLACVEDDVEPETAMVCRKCFVTRPCFCEPAS